MLPVLDNHDPRIRYYELALERSLEDLPARELPEGYRLETWAAGDREAWIAIEQSARELRDREQGLKVWEQYFGGHERELPGRMYFVLNAAGEKVATATAFYDIRRGDDGVTGVLHWVAVRREEQGRGLSKPLILHVLRRMAEQPGRVLSREELQGKENETFERAIDVQIGHIRAALGDGGKKRIVTVRGSGYLFAKKQD